MFLVAKILGLLQQGAVFVAIRVIPTSFKKTDPSTEEPKATRKIVSDIVRKSRSLS